MAEAKDSEELMWVLPDWRGIFPLDAFHVPKSLKKVVRQDRFDVRLNTAFPQVMRLCASEEAGRTETWINDDILESYEALFRAGHAYSVESWLDNQLVGGLYGVSVESAFFGESMFSLATDASKVALCHLVGRMKMAGYRLLDTQFLTPHLARFGGIEVPADAYRQLLARALEKPASLADYSSTISGTSILQSITQTS